MTNGFCAKRILIIDKALYFLFCRGLRAISLGRCGSIPLTLWLNALKQPGCPIQSISQRETCGTGRTFDGHFQLSVGERHKLVCVYSFTDPLTPATPPVSPLALISLGVSPVRDDKWGEGTSQAWALWRGSDMEVSLGPLSFRPGSSLMWPALTPG